MATPATRATPPASLTPAEEAWSIVFQLALGNRARLVGAFNALGLTFPQAHALRLISPGEPMPMSEVAERLVCDASNVTGIADRLEARGLIERRPAVGDRRVKALALTTRGVEVREQLLAAIAAPPPAIAALPDHDQRALLQILQRAVAPA